jgi:uncharacterized cupredoxin-like copper-binding protein
MNGRASAVDAAIAIVFGATLALGLAMVGLDPRVEAPVRIEIGIRYSQFEPSSLAVPHGRPVTFVLRNDDPIDHEWMIGDDAMHLRHRTGTEPFHASRPTEVSIPALTTLETTVTFADQVTWRYICHLPGHEAYGMVGTLTAR